MTTETPSLLLVHGAWHGPWSWAALQPELGDADVHTVALPSAGPDPRELGDLRADAAVIRDAVRAIDRPTVVVAHSYGGLPTTEALGGLPDVVGVIYLAAFVLDVGQSLTSAFTDGAPDWWDLHPEEGYVDALRPKEIFYHDVEPATAAKCGALLAHHSLAAMGQPLTEAAWRHLPSSYVVCDQDRAIPPAAQEAMATRTGTVHHLPSSHSPFLSRPAELAELIRRQTTAFLD